jgi:tRNA pseudouridine55 synthase
MNEFVNRVVVINKQVGPTSFDVVEAFRKASRIRKVGHTGTLDPLAQGVLLLCSGKATRAVEHFMDLPKVYEFDVRLGVETTTLDVEGEVVREAPCPDLPETRIIEVAESFLGSYRLEPPAYSALKHNGRRLYQLAREGKNARAEERTVTVYAMEVLDIALPVVRCRMKCSRGTYVRSVARDFGARLDLPAHIQNLVRSAIGPFRIEEAFPSQQIFDMDLAGLRVIKLVDALQFLPGIVIRDGSKRALLDGVLPTRGDVVETIGDMENSAPVRILDEAGELLAIGNRRAPGGYASWVESYRLLVDRQV